MERFQGQVAIVTGATGGIGSATARRLAAEGALLVVSGRSAERGTALAEELGDRAIFTRGDLTESGTREALVGVALERWGRLDVLVNNAALDHAHDLVTTPLDDVRQLFEINFYAALRLLQLAVPAMGDGGAVVNVTSRLATVGVATMGIYGATKGALLALTRAAAIELAPRGIRVNAVAPGMTRTPLHSAWAATAGDPALVEAETAAQIPQHRLAEPDEIAAAIAYLASSDASHVTGSSLAVDGGYTAA